MQELNLLDKEILRLQRLLVESEEKLEYLTGSDRTKELYHNGNLHWQIRKYTTLANKNFNVYYCSRCGYKFNSWKERVIHVKEDHEDQ